MFLVSSPGREAIWERLEGRTLKNLHSFVFEGLPHEFTRRIISVLQRAPNVSSLDLHNIWACPNVELPWPPGDPVPNLSTLRLRNFLISWASPFLRNLRQLTLEAVPSPFPSGHTSIEIFLAVLADSPNLEVLNLAHTGPDLPNSHRDDCDVMVQLRTLRQIFLEFRDPPRVGYILSHIEYPESTYLSVVVPLDVDTDPSETISQVLPHRKIGTIQHSRKPIDLTVCLGSELLFYTDHLSIRLQNRRGLMRRVKPQAFTWFASKVVEVIKRDVIVSLAITIQYVDPTEEMWEVFLHGLPQLERICYELERKKGDQNLIDPFLSIFSRPFEGGPVCPQLQYLELPRVVLSEDSSAAVLKCALTKRDAYGRRLKRIGLSGDTREKGDRLVLEPFRDFETQ